MNGLVSSVSLALVAALVPAAPAPAPVHASAAVAPIPRDPVPCDDAYLGVYVSPSEAGGAAVARLMDGSPAQKAGLLPGDRIVAIAGSEVRDPDALIASIDARSAGDRVELVYYRGDDKRIVTLALGNRAQAEMPEPVELGFELPPGPDAGPRTPLGIHMDRVPALSEPGPSPPRAPGPQSTAADADLARRLDDLRARMDERWDSMDERLEEFRRQSDREDGGRDRIDDLRREMRETRESQQQRLEELRDAVRAKVKEHVESGATASGTRRQGLDATRTSTLLPRRSSVSVPSIRTETVRTDAVPAPPVPPPLHAEGLPRRMMPSPAPDAPATAAAVRALHDDVRALRKEIQELRELLGGVR